jgi:PAS domain S-box-containing protein
VGQSQKELVGSVFMPATNDRYSDVIASQMTKLFRPPYECIVEQWIHTRKGARCISWSARSIPGKDSIIEAIVAVGHDITRQKKELQRIRKRDDALMLVIESDVRMYYTHTPDQKMLYVSPRIRQLLGCIGKDGKNEWTQYLSDNPVNAAGLERTLRAIRSGKREPPYRLEMVRRDGSRIWVEVSEVPVVKNNKTVAIAGSMIDISEKMQVDEKIAEAEVLIKDYRSARDGNPDTGSHSRAFGFFKSLLGHDSSGNQESRKKSP